MRLTEIENRSGQGFIKDTEFKQLIEQIKGQEFDQLYELLRDIDFARPGNFEVLYQYKVNDYEEQQELA